MSGFIEFIKIVIDLNGNHRTGCVDADIGELESVADHCFRMEVLSMVFADLWELDTEKP